MIVRGRAERGSRICRFLKISLQKLKNASTLIGVNFLAFVTGLVDTGSYVAMNVVLISPGFSFTSKAPICWLRP